MQWKCKCHRASCTQPTQTSSLKNVLKYKKLGWCGAVGRQKISKQTHAKQDKRAIGQQIGVLQRHVALPDPQSLAVNDGPVPFSLHGPWPLLKHRAYSGRTASCAISAAHGGPRFSSSKPYVRQ